MLYCHLQTKFLSSFHVALLVEMNKTLHWHRCKDIQIANYKLAFPMVNAHHFIHFQKEKVDKAKAVHLCELKWAYNWCLWWEGISGTALFKIQVSFPLG